MATLKIAYGDLDADVEGLHVWCEKKMAVKSELSRLNRQFSK